VQQDGIGTVVDVWHWDCSGLVTLWLVDVWCWGWFFSMYFIVISAMLQISHTSVTATVLC